MFNDMNIPCSASLLIAPLLPQSIRCLAECFRFYYYPATAPQQLVYFGNLPTISQHRNVESAGLAPTSIRQISAGNMNFISEREMAYDSRSWPM